MSTLFFNVLIGAVAVAAFYNIYKGRNPPPKGKGGKPGNKSSSSSGWFQNMGMGGM